MSQPSILEQKYVQPQARRIRGGLFPLYALEQKYNYNFRYKGLPVTVAVPEGFEYSATFGSFLFWRKDIHQSAHTLFHDWVYSNRSSKTNNAHVTMTCGIVAELTKADCDKLFLQGVRRDLNVQNWRAAIASGVFKTIGHIVWRT